MHYKLLNPEPITDSNVQIQGKFWSIVPDDNYINIDTGMILNEAANPILATTGESYYINCNYSNTSASYLKNKAEIVTSVYRNGIYDNWNRGYDLKYANGKEYPW
jgi:hypothetical protein